MNNLCPGYMKTDLIIDLLEKEGKHIEEVWVKDVPMGRLGHPSELQSTIVWMATSSYLNGSDIVSLDQFPDLMSNSSLQRLIFKVVDGGYCCW